jgi:hypothetical protein
MEFYFSLNISSQEYIRYYQGSARKVIVRVQDGRTVQFPAGHLRQFVTPKGVQGKFVLRTDDNHKLIDIRRLD